jgi:putative sporulation protein YtaF
MRFTALAFLEAFLIACSLSLDALTAGFVYGSSKIKIPFGSVQIMNVICSSVTGLSLLAGAFLCGRLPPKLTGGISFGILLVLGATKLLNSITKQMIRRHSNLQRELHFSLFNFRVILQLYADPKDADFDLSNTITAAEAASMAAALSLDGVGVGFGAALGHANALLVFLFSLLTNAAGIWLGALLGRTIVGKTKMELSWLGGAVLIFLAVSKLI